MSPHPNKTAINETNKNLGLNNNQHKIKNIFISRIIGNVNPNKEGNHHLSGGI